MQNGVQRSMLHDETIFPSRTDRVLLRGVILIPQNINRSDPVVRLNPETMGKLILASIGLGVFICLIPNVYICRT